MVPLKGFTCPFKLHSIVAVAHLLALNNLWLCCYGQVNLVQLKDSVAWKWASKHLWGVPFIVLLVVPLKVLTCQLCSMYEFSSF